MVLSIFGTFVRNSRFTFYKKLPYFRALSRKLEQKLNQNRTQNTRAQRSATRTDILTDEGEMTLDRSNGVSCGFNPRNIKNRKSIFTGGF